MQLNGRHPQLPSFVPNVCRTRVVITNVYHPLFSNQQSSLFFQKVPVFYYEPSCMKKLHSSISTLTFLSKCLHFSIKKTPFLSKSLHFSINKAPFSIKLHFSINKTPFSIELHFSINMTSFSIELHFTNNKLLFSINMLGFSFDVLIFQLTS